MKLNKIILTFSGLSLMLATPVLAQHHHDDMGAQHNHEHSMGTSQMNSSMGNMNSKDMGNMGNMDSKSMGTMNHGSMGMGQGNMMMAKLGPGKKSEFKSRKGGHFIISAPQVPKTDGMAVFNVTIKTKEGKALSKDAMVMTDYEMPGMKMDLPKMTSERLSDEEWKISIPLSMPGMWKVHFKIRDRGVKDHIHVKFITK